MKRPTKNLVKVVVSFALGLTSGVPAFAAAQSCDSIQKECKKALEAQDAANNMNGAAHAMAAGANNIPQQAAGQASTSAAGCTGFTQVKDSCQTSLDKCNTICKTPTDQSKCTKNLTDLVAQAGGAAQSLCNATPQSTATGDAAKGQPPGDSQGAGGGSGGGMGSMGAGLIGALAGGLLGYMMGKKAAKDDKKDDGALQANGTIDCSKDDAYKYQDCNDYLSGICSSEISAGTYGSDAKCSNFGQRYCGSGTAPVLAAVVPVSGSALVSNAPTTSSEPPQGVVGEGAGSAMCQSVMAMNYCKTAGRSQCPSCLQLARTQSSACTTNPALCLAQNSPAQIATAKTTCPTDPAFSNPSYAAGGGAVATQLNTSGAALPAVVLPQSVDGGASASGSASGMVVASVGGGGSANREGAATGPDSATGSGAAAGASGAAVSGRSEVANGSGSYKPASVGRGPASDIQGQFGPSLFAMSTQVYKDRCQAGKLNNCP